MKNTILCFTVLTMLSCSTSKMNKNKDVKLIDVQGHRGCRGLLPENTLIAFEKALHLGVTTLEMDLVISKDKEVIVSHEPFFNHEISTAPGGLEITADNQLEHNIYKLTADEITSYDVGLKSHDRFPDQKNIGATKPLLKEVIAKAESLSKKNNRPLPYYNVEIKRKPEADNIFHPGVEEFSALVVSTIQGSGIKERIFIQSFDVASLKETRANDPEIKLVLLIENMDSPEINLANLGFTPEVYSPYYKLVTEELVSYCRTKGMKLIPWTVNEVKDMELMLELGVDGIITDFPDILIDHISQNAAYNIMQ